jgi:hypothetical protein
VDYLYPTDPPDLRGSPRYADTVHPDLYHGCIGWVAEQWMTFRLELDMAFCRERWTDSAGMPASCGESKGRIRMWVKYASEKVPWLVMDRPMPLRWRSGHSERYGRFSFLPYNTNESPNPAKAPAFTLYDDILVARNAEDLPWPAD